MPSPQSNRANLDKARREGRVIFWRAHSESQRVKAEIVWLHETKPGLSQRTIARMFHVSQPYVVRVLKRVRRSGGDIERALGLESYRHYRALLEGQRRAHFQAQGGPASLIVEGARQSSPGFEAPQSTTTITAAARVEAPGTKYVELVRTRDDQIIEGHDSKPAYALTDGEQQFPNPRPMVHPGIPLDWVLDPRAPRCDLSLWLKAKH